MRIHVNGEAKDLIIQHAELKGISAQAAANELLIKFFKEEATMPKEISNGKVKD